MTWSPEMMPMSSPCFTRSRTEGRLFWASDTVNVFTAFCVAHREGAGKLVCRISANGLRLEWQGGVEVKQFVERTEDLSPSVTRWLVIYTNHPPTLLQTNLFDFLGTNRTLFYRIRAVRE
jgi:hypothetical protein